MFGFDVPKDRFHQITEHFRVTDFLTSEVMPSLRDYQIDAVQWLNTRKMAVCVLERLYQDVGQVMITSGGRPGDIVDAQGRGFVELLREQGLSPATPSQHEDFSAVDVKFTRRQAYLDAFRWLRRHPAIRQVILYVNREGYPIRMHIGIITPYWTGTKPKALLFTPEHSYVAATKSEMDKWLAV
jgi:hypothetical protein